MKTFDKEINNFLLTGTFENNFDDVNNINLSTVPVDVNQQYVAFYLTNNLYNTQQIESLYDVKITELSIPVATSVTASAITDATTLQLIQDNTNLQTQLNSLISASNQNSSSAIVDASKDIIINLRIQLGQGTSVDDFSSDFPYLKK